jgi:hypothetical protein
MSEAESINDVAALTVQLLSAYLANNAVASEDLAGLIRSTRDALTAEQAEVPQAEPETVTPAVSVRKSLASREHIISLIDGKPYKTLKRHLMAHGLTPDESAAGTTCLRVTRWWLRRTLSTAVPLRSELDWAAGRALPVRARATRTINSTPSLRSTRRLLRRKQTLKRRRSRDEQRLRRSPRAFVRPRTALQVTRHPQPQRRIWHLQTR